MPQNEVCKANVENEWRIDGRRFGREAGGALSAGTGLLVGIGLVFAAPEIAGAAAVTAGFVSAGLGVKEMFDRAKGHEPKDQTPGLVSFGAATMNMLKFLPGQIAAPVAVTSTLYTIGRDYGEATFGALGAGIGRLRGEIHCTNDPNDTYSASMNLSH